MISWYLFVHQHHNFVARAVEFIISIRNHPHSPSFSFLSKIVCGRIVRDDGQFIYPLVPSLPNFIKDILNQFQPYFTNWYYEEDWCRAERVLKMIITGKDFSFLPKVEKLILLLENRKFEPSPRQDSTYAKDVHLAILKATRRILKQAQREALKNLQV